MGPHLLIPNGTLTSLMVLFSVIRSGFRVSRRIWSLAIRPATRSGSGAGTASNLIAVVERRVAESESTGTRRNGTAVTDLAGVRTPPVTTSAQSERLCSAVAAMERREEAASAHWTRTRKTWCLLHRRRRFNKTSAVIMSKIAVAPLSRFKNTLEPSLQVLVPLRGYEQWSFIRPSTVVIKNRVYASTPHFKRISFMSLFQIPFLWRQSCQLLTPRRVWV